jgi:hypothetical protein
VLTESVEEPDVVTDAGVNVPFGSPLWLRLTVPVKPPVAPTETVYDAFVPWVTVAVAGDAPTVKSGVGGGGADWTTRVAETECVSDPLVAVIVKG